MTRKRGVVLDGLRLRALAVPEPVRPRSAAIQPVKRKRAVKAFGSRPATALP